MVVQPIFGVKSLPCLWPQTRAPVVHSPSSVMKTAITKLQEYCQQNDVKLPEYKDNQVTGGFRCTVTVRGKQYSGETKSKKQDAKHSAAEVALQKLNSPSKLSHMSIVIAIPTYLASVTGPEKTEHICIIHTCSEIGIYL